MRRKFFSCLCAIATLTLVHHSSQCTWKYFQLEYWKSGLTMLTTVRQQCTVETLENFAQKNLPIVCKIGQGIAVTLVLANIFGNLFLGKAVMRSLSNTPLIKTFIFGSHAIEPKTDKPSGT